MFSANSSQVSNDANYIEDVFSTYLYTGNGSTQTITNGIDLAGKGGLVWTKNRLESPTFNYVLDSARDNFTQQLITSLTAAQSNGNAQVTPTSSGFSLSAIGVNNDSDRSYASWTFRKQPKFFDVVTYTGNGTSSNTIAHSLGSTPGCIIVKATGLTSNWAVYHRSIPSNYILLNSTAAATTPSIFSVSSTDFTLTNSSSLVNGSGQTYVAYLFAHNAGGFGLTGTDNVISCGSFTTDAFGDPTTVNLGYEPQWVLLKSATSAASWFILDNMRGWSNSSSSKSMTLLPNTSGAEAYGTVGADNLGSPTATGFTIKGVNAADTMIYIAIRRGPMKVPTSGTSVYYGYQPHSTGATIAVGFPSDFVLTKQYNGVSGWGAGDRLRGNDAYLIPNNTNAEASFANTWGFTQAQNSTNVNYNGANSISYFYRRAPSFFDEVCYTGVGYPTALTNTHNLGVAPEMMIVKNRSNTQSWFVYHVAMGNNQEMYLNQAASQQLTNFDWNSTTPSATTFTVNSSTNNSGQTYVAYLFATCAGVSKVGSYTGTGTTQQINCGFTAGARFVLIKRTDSTGDWYVWDTARGIVSGNDPYLLLNSTAAEVTITDYIDTYSAGFELSTTAAATVNVLNGTYIYLAIA